MKERAICPVCAAQPKPNQPCTPSGYSALGLAHAAPHDNTIQPRVKTGYFLAAGFFAAVERRFLEGCAESSDDASSIAGWL